jgi:hypothetical protein
LWIRTAGDLIAAPGAAVAGAHLYRGTGLWAAEDIYLFVAAFEQWGTICRE